MALPDTSQQRPTVSSMMTDHLGRVGVRSGQILLALILATVVVYALIQLKLVVIPILIALIVAAAVGPVVNWLIRHRFPPALATALVMISGVAIFGGVLTLIVFAVRNQWGELIESASEGVDQLIGWASDLPIPVDAAQIQEARDAAIDFVTSSQFGSGALAGVSVATQLVTGLLLVLVILFFFLKDGGAMWRFFLRPFPGYQQKRGERIGHTSLTTLGGYVRGTAIIALVDAVGIYIGLLILQVPLALPLAVVVFIGAFIPLIGATLAGVLAALVALVANGPTTALWVVVVIIIVNQLEGNLLQPIVMAQSLKLHPLVVLFALTAGTILGGIIGAVLSVPLAAVTWAIIKVWNRPEDRATSPELESNPDPGPETPVLQPTPRGRRGRATQALRR
ncbi:AI-2E family transporter [Planctomonas psychrotolerans]|uniref:AI-2E family transporter n=1 Tax=Planctomonas psychrotolerans TaxID=2528712 RepID=UPI00123B3593|nr:AI-2E family transporter [Planctomonas psychrotolerans]